MPSKQSVDLPTIKVENVPPCIFAIESGALLTLRLMKVDDYDTVRRMLPKVSRCSSIHSQDFVSRMLAMPNFFPFVLETHEDQIVAYAELHRLPHLGRSFDGRLEKVVVIEEMRGKKVAQMMCHHLIDIARTKLACGRVDLTVEKDDAKAVYKRLGFAPVETEVWRLIF